MTHKLPHASVTGPLEDGFNFPYERDRNITDRKSPFVSDICTTVVHTPTTPILRTLKSPNKYQ